MMVMVPWGSHFSEQANLTQQDQGRSSGSFSSLSITLHLTLSLHLSPSLSITLISPSHHVFLSYLHGSLFLSLSPLPCSFSLLLSVFPPNRAGFATSLLTIGMNFLEALCV